MAKLDSTIHYLSGLAPYLLSSKQPLDHGLMGVKKLNELKIFMQVEVDVKCMQTNFGGHGLSGFWRLGFFCCLQKQPKFPFGP